MRLPRPFRLPTQDVGAIIEFLRADQPLLSTEVIQKEVAMVIDVRRRKFERDRATALRRAAQFHDEDVLKGVLKASAEYDCNLEQHLLQVQRDAETKRRLFDYLLEMNVELAKARHDQFPVELSN